MNHGLLAKAYKTFFMESEEGQYFMKEITRLINANHEKAEEDPALARDYVQRAKGAREIMLHINGVVVESKKGKPMS